MTRRLPAKVERVIAEQAGYFRDAYRDYRKREEVDYLEETQRLAGYYAVAAGWFEKQARKFGVEVLMDEVMKISD